jgi:hypothetical protein
MIWLKKLLFIYLLIVILGTIIISVVEKYVPEYTRFKKWWRKHIISNNMED